MYTASNMGVTGFLFRFLSLFLGIAVPWNGVCRGQLYPPWFAYYPPNYSAWLPAGSALGWGAGAGQGIAGAYYDDLNVPPISTLSATAAAANQGRALSGAPPPANNLQSVTQSAAFTKINDITAKSTASVSSSDTQLTAVNENFQSSSSAASVPGACSGSRSARTEKERQIYMFSCAQLPEGLRDYVGCPLELPFDLSFNRVIGYAPIKDVFVNADLQQSGQLVEGDMRTPSTKDLLGIRHVSKCN
ncbi:uncharacterized protein LOC129601291 [Paramacrobiotus metropolitanus]|uniref:uncharacterized protein LOC129601291 n=1 Tax=Paramacrobiotus metropolitanus TaxID=2943436 RepID=UPI002445E3AA|nr:uncharacterized protein LOC129601291 [Paramacrobiotus metropolitanus]